MPSILFGLVLAWKRLRERCLERSGLDWTVIRPGGLNEAYIRSTTEGVLVTDADQQHSNRIPQRLVAQVCLDAPEQSQACGRILESPALQPSPSRRWASAWIRFPASPRSRPDSPDAMRC